MARPEQMQPHSNALIVCLGMGMLRFCTQKHASPQATDANQADAGLQNPPSCVELCLHFMLQGMDSADSVLSLLISAGSLTSQTGSAACLSMDACLFKLARRPRSCQHQRVKEGGGGGGGGHMLASHEIQVGGRSTCKCVQHATMLI